MILKCGNDIVNETRIKELLANPGAVESVFHPSEITQFTISRTASVFALKECVIKALELTTSSWLEIEIKYKETGKPYVILSDLIKPKKLLSIDCSTSHENDTTFAVVLMLIES